MVHTHKVIQPHEISTEGLGEIRRKGLSSWFVLRQFQTPTFFQLVADCLAILMSFVVFYFLKLSSSQSNAVVTTTEFLVKVLSSTVVFWIVVFWLGGLYKNWYVRSPFDEFFTVIKATLTAGTIVLVAMYIESQYVRVKFVLYVPIVLSLVCANRLIARRIQRSMRMSGKISVPTLVVGRPLKISSLLHQVQRERAWGFDVLGYALAQSDDQPMTIEDKRCLGKVEELGHILDHAKPSTILLALDSADHELMLEIVSDANDRGISVMIEPDLYEIVTGQVKTLQIYGSPLIEVNPELLRPWQKAVKRLLDVSVSAVVLVAGIPIWCLIALIVKLESRGPALFSQQRIGRNGQVFRMYKFRSMVQDAEKHGQQWTKVGDPRVTRFGYFLRKTHLDEIPQLWNILIGDMSLVGPRPEQPRYVELFSAHIPYYHRRHKVRPGLTGWWQVKYTSYEENLDEIRDRIRYDFFYIENMSLRLDFEIIVRTVFLMFRGHGQA